MWCAARRLNQGGFKWPRGGANTSGLHLFSSRSVIGRRGVLREGRRGLWSGHRAASKGSLPVELRREEGSASLTDRMVAVGLEGSTSIAPELAEQGKVLHSDGLL
jgi:hypothetical protein